MSSNQLKPNFFSSKHSSQSQPENSQGSKQRNSKQPKDKKEPKLIRPPLAYITKPSYHAMKSVYGRRRVTPRPWFSISPRYEKSVWVFEVHVRKTYIFSP
ncbi:hypothetical protein KFK09_018316 [Dendrobium nobile]|uniref:Uncharacterized protein n=1 Tax=Dendrobium nobile TaxID=94219 RepID=A0A8T3AVN7_DENNO|nr:hypothetical protein KFK09_018316 [Dendrobium nobile]